MATFTELVRVATLAVVAGASAAACGGGGGGGGGEETGFTVTSQVISDPTTQDIRVLSPEGEGNWPVVIALHGNGGSGQDMVELGTRLAGEGALVFLPTYNTDFTTADDLIRAADDIACAYQVARRIAPEHGGDLTKPVTALGWSLGADFVLLGGLQGSGENTSSRCPGEIPRPDVVVGLSGCYYENEGRPVTWFDDITNWGNKSADIRLFDGDEDAVCPAWQTEQLEASLRAAGYNVELVELHGANHFAPVFHDMVDGEWQVIVEDPAGEQVVDAVIGAITVASVQAPGS